MLEYSHGEIGWDVFTLEYKVDAPIDTVLDPDSMVKYLECRMDANSGRRENVFARAR